jgi:hypothetical protein
MWPCPTTSATPALIPAAAATVGGGGGAAGGRDGVGASGIGEGGVGEGGVGEGGDGDDDPHLGLHIAGGGLAGDPLDQGVGHDLVECPRVPAAFEGVGVLPQCRPAGHPLLDGQVGREHAHRVRRRPHPHPDDRRAR